MNSTTPTLGIGVEYDTTTTASTGNKYVYRINSIDLGIVERPRQEIGILKRINTMKVTLANGQVITDISIDENGNITGEKGDLIYMGPSETTIPKNGFVRLEMDNELIQGARVELTYRIVVTNNSELDYLSQDFYNYGIQGGEVVTITPKSIIDYLDNEWAFDAANNSIWQTKTLDDIKNDDRIDEQVYNNPSSTIEQKIILETNALENVKLKPNDSEQITLNVSKILTNSDEIELDNETEIIEIEKTGGSDLTSTPGNYIPGTGKTESDDDMAETVIITPATGSNYNFIITVAIGVALLVILGVGVILIKKKALGNNKE